MRNCGLQARQMTAEQYQVFEKGQDDYVTTVDRELDRQLTQGFAALFPNDRIITEENSQSWASFTEAAQRLWLIDPLDGTEDFIQGSPHYSVMAGLLVAGQPLAGWVYAPTADCLWYGGPNWGLFQAIGEATANPLSPTAPKPPSAESCPILLGQRDQQRYGPAIQKVIPGVRFDSIGSFGLKVLQVITGQAGLYVYLNGRVKLWDTVGPLALAKAAGLICCDLAGEPLQFTTEGVDRETLAHQQSILIGWEPYVEILRSPLQKAIQTIQ